MISKTNAPIRSGRYDWVDYAKGIAIFLVVYRHVFEGLKRSGLDATNFIGLEYANIVFFSFRMPLFFIISGMFISSSLAKRGFKVLFGQKAKTILYPYFLWGGLQLTLQVLLSGYVNSDRTVKDYIYLIYAPRALDQFWYLYALFNVTILYAFLKTYLKLSSGVQLILGVLMYYFSAHATQHFWDIGFLQDVCHYYVFFVLGDIVGKYFRNENNANKIGSWKTVLLLLPLFVISQLYFLHANVQNNSEGYQYVERYEPTLFFFIAMTGCMFMVAISFILQRYSAASWLRVIGVHSLYIYVMHVIIASGTRIILVKVFGITYLPLLLAIGIFVSVFLSIIFYRFCQSRGWYFLFSLDKPRGSPAGKQSPGSGDAAGK